MSGLPEVFISRYFAEDVLASGEVVPVRISLRSPQRLGIELPYPLEYGADLLMKSAKHGWSRAGGKP